MGKVEGIERYSCACLAATLLNGCHSQPFSGMFGCKVQNNVPNNFERSGALRRLAVSGLDGISRSVENNAVKTDDACQNESHDSCISVR